MMSATGNVRSRGQSGSAADQTATFNRIRAEALGFIAVQLTQSWAEAV